MPIHLSRASRWGGQFECLIGLVKTALNQTELYEVVLDVEIAYNNCSLHYIEDDIQLPVLTSASP